MATDEAKAAEPPIPGTTEEAYLSPTADFVLIAFLTAVVALAVAAVIIP
jgi:hypothetical protein